MSRNRKGRGSFDGDLEDFVPAVFARTPDEAEEYRELLNDHDIPAIIHEDDEEKPARPGRAPATPRKGISRGVPVLVPEALLDEASEVIADRDYHGIQPGEGIEEDDDDEEEEDDAVAASPDEADEADEADEPGPPASKREPKDNPFEDEGEDVFGLDEDEETDGILEEAADLGEEVEEEDEDEEKAGPEEE